MTGPCLPDELLQRTHAVELEQFNRIERQAGDDPNRSFNGVERVEPPLHRIEIWEVLAPNAGRVLRRKAGINTKRAVPFQDTSSLLQEGGHDEMVNGIEGEHHVDRVRVEGKRARVRSNGLEAVDIGMTQETRSFGDHVTVPIEAGQMELRHYPQEEKGIPARTATNVHGVATIVFREQISYVCNWFAVGTTDVVVLLCYFREMLVHIIHVEPSQCVSLFYYRRGLGKEI